MQAAQSRYEEQSVQLGSGEGVYDRRTFTSQAIQRTNTALHELPPGPALALGASWTADLGIAQIDCATVDLYTYSVL